MTRQELYSILIQVLVGSTPIGVYYNHFVSTPENPTIKLPFILYKQNDTTPYVADGTVYDTEASYIVDLCVEKIEDVEALESQIETLFDTHEIVWSKNEDYLNSEKMYQIEYYI